MIIANANITFIASVGGGFDEQTGRPLKVTEERERVLGQIVPLVLNNIAHSEGGITKQASYRVLLSSAPLKGSKRVEIESETGELLGAFAIISINHLRAVGQWEVLV